MKRAWQGGFAALEVESGSKGVREGGGGQCGDFRRRLWPAREVMGILRDE